MLCFVVVMQSFMMNSHEVFIHIHQGCFAGTGAIVRLPQCQWNKPDGYGKISQCITTTKHSKAKTVCTFLRIYCTDIQQRQVIRKCITTTAVILFELGYHVKWDVGKVSPWLFESHDIKIEALNFVKYPSCEWPFYYFYVMLIGLFRSQ